MIRIQRSLYVIVFDALMALASLWVAYGLVYGMHQYPIMRISLLSLGFTVLFTGAYLLFGMQRRMWRFSSIPDFASFAWLALVACAVYAPAVIVFARGFSHASTLPIVHFVVTAAMLVAPRVFYRLWRSGDLHMLLPGGLRWGQAPVNVLLVGSGDAAELFIRSLYSNRNAGYRVVGIVDTNSETIGRAIRSVRILGLIKDLEAVLNTLKGTSKQPNRLIFTENIKELDGFALQKIAEKYGIKISRLPGITEFQEGLMQGQGAMQLKPIDIEDLLGRAQAQIDYDAIYDFIAGKSVLVTGAGGTIGSELARQIIAAKPSKLIALDNSEYNLYNIETELAGSECKTIFKLCDIRDKNALMRVFDEAKPDLVFHAAALKHVPIVERHPDQGVLTNIIGTRNVADCARASEVEAFVQISTDKAVNPTNVMGATKRLAEYYCQALDLDKDKRTTRFMTVRFGNVMGSSGSVVPLFRKQIMTGGPVTVTHPDVTRFFMTVREAVGLTLQASAIGMKEDNEKGRIFVLDMKEPIKILDIARQMIRLADLDPDKDIEITFTGLRPGEKLYEELFDSVEDKEKTDIPGTFSAKPSSIEKTLLVKNIAKLEEAARVGEKETLVTLLKTLVPGYSQNSAETSLTKRSKIA